MHRRTIKPEQDDIDININITCKNKNLSESDSDLAYIYLDDVCEEIEFEPTHPPLMSQLSIHVLADTRYFTTCMSHY